VGSNSASRVPHAIVAGREAVEEHVLAPDELARQRRRLGPLERIGRDKLVQAEPGQRYPADWNLKRPVGAVGELPRALQLVEQRGLAEQVARNR